MVPIFEVDLESTSDVVWFLAIAAGVALIGALVAELMAARGKSKETGMFELPRRRGRYFDVGSLTAIPAGALTGVIAVFLFSPTREIVEGTTSTTKYDLVRLIALSAIAGLSATAFIASLQEKFTALLTAERLTKALEAASTALRTVEAKAAASAGPASALGEAGTSAATEIQAQAQLAQQQIQQVLA